MIRAGPEKNLCFNCGQLLPSKSGSQTNAKKPPMALKAGVEPTTVASRNITDGISKSPPKMFQSHPHQKQLITFQRNDNDSISSSESLERAKAGESKFDHLGIDMDQQDPASQKAQSHMTPQFKNKTIKFNSILAQEINSNEVDQNLQKQNQEAVPRGQHKANDSFEIVNNPSASAAPVKGVDHLNSVIKAVNADILTDKAKPFPVVKKTGNIIIAHNKSGIPLANKGRLAKIKQRPMIPSNPLDEQPQPNLFNQFQVQTTKNNIGMPLSDLSVSFSSNLDLKHLDSSTPEPRPLVPIYGGTEDQAHRLKMATRRKKNLPSLNFSQRNRMTGSTQNLPRDNIDGLVSLEQKLSDLMVDIRTKINPQAHESREFGNNYQVFINNSSASISSKDDMRMRKASSVERLGTKLKPNYPYRTARQKMTRSNQKDHHPGLPYAQLEFSTSNLNILSQNNTSTKVRCRSSLDTNEAIHSSVRNIGCILTSNPEHRGALSSNIQEHSQSQRIKPLTKNQAILKEYMPHNDQLDSRNSKSQFIF